MSLDPKRPPVVSHVVAWLEIGVRFEALGDGALAAAVTAAMNGHWLGMMRPSIWPRKNGYGCRRR